MPCISLRNGELHLASDELQQELERERAAAKPKTAREQFVEVEAQATLTQTLSLCLLAGLDCSIAKAILDDLSRKMEETGQIESLLRADVKGQG